MVFVYKQLTITFIKLIRVRHCFAFLVPSGVIFNLAVVNRTANTVHLNWSAVPFMERRGVITKYEAAVTRLFRDWEEEALEEEALSLNVSILETLDIDLGIFDLDNYTEYEVAIAAHTAIGGGRLSKVFVFETLQNGEFSFV